MLISLFFFLHVLHQNLAFHTTEDVELLSKLLVKQLKPLILEKRWRELNKELDNVSINGDTRVFIFDSEGGLRASISKTFPPHVSETRRPEFAKALQGTPRKMTAVDPFSGVKRVSVHTPVFLEDRTVALVTLSRGIPSFFSPLRAFKDEIPLLLASCLILALGASWMVSRNLRKPLRKLRTHISRFTAGNLSERTTSFETEELSLLADELNILFAEVETRLKHITERHEELNTILSSMEEGLIAVDNLERIININNAASHLLFLNTRHVQGRYVHEVVRQAEIQNFIREIIETGETKQTVIPLFINEERYFQLQGTSIREQDGKLSGALVVFNDITRLRKLENMRRDFVANVSHEIKTPLTAIRGSVETLMDGAMDSKKDAKRFFRIIIKHTERLNALIEDILNLSLIEEQTESGKLLKTSVILNNIIRSVAELCSPKAKNRNINIVITKEDQVVIEGNRQLLEQALINLVDNAVKFSDKGSEVHIGLEKSGNEVRLSVKDFGCGIPESAMKRVFERFYMVDKARSKKLGGTGLGLAIVKHVAQIHQGRVSVESVVGEGSVFSLFLPTDHRFPDN